ncbi:leucine rich repeat [Seminavis robusta]|uniref:Leucine rich repeat n=1 Tax=Seminavis robusta TaxID=568900 RepID=A0A9N8EK36_9STRA|nr:leucine rich repeat [Seminavis robusta]|eukprot:Sro1129_g244370.1 leucine rich repeat (280) ;mRNA; f:18247-19293
MTKTRLLLLPALGLLHVALPLTAAQDALSEIQAIVQPVALFGGNEWTDPANYQAKAIAWLESDPVSANNNNNNIADARIQQRYALACIYYATFAVPTMYTVAEPRGWIDATGWLSDADECTWFGLTCNDNSEVEKIALGVNRLTGTFPAETAIMASSITHIDLFRNYVHNAGDAGNAWMGQLTNLTHLYYGQTNFEYDGIPPQIGQLTNLIEYDCSFTRYFGPLAGSTFAPLQNLEYLVLTAKFSKVIERLQVIVFRRPLSKIQRTKYRRRARVRTANR